MGNKRNAHFLLLRFGNTILNLFKKLIKTKDTKYQQGFDSFNLMTEEIKFQTTVEHQWPEP